MKSGSPTPSAYPTRVSAVIADASGPVWFIPEASARNPAGLGVHDAERAGNHGVSAPAASEIAALIRETPAARGHSVAAEAFTGCVNA